MKKYLVLSLLISLFFVSTKDVQAKTLPQARKGVVKQSANNTSIGVSPKLRAGKKALMVYFSNLQNASAVSYMLKYKTNGQEEGAMGGLNLTGKSSDSAELLFGTCSKNVCRYHNNISNAKLEVSYTNKLGKKYLKKFRINI